MVLGQLDIHTHTNKSRHKCYIFTKLIQMNHMLGQNYKILENSIGVNQDDFVNYDDFSDRTQKQGP